MASLAAWQHAMGGRAGNDRGGTCQPAPLRAWRRAALARAIWVRAWRWRGGSFAAVTAWR